VEGIVSGIISPRIFAALVGIFVLLCSATVRIVRAIHWHYCSKAFSFFFFFILSLSLSLSFSVRSSPSPNLSLLSRSFFSLFPLSFFLFRSQRRTTLLEFYWIAATAFIKLDVANWAEALAVDPLSPAPALFSAIIPSIQIWRVAYGASSTRRIGPFLASNPSSALFLLLLFRTYENFPSSSYFYLRFSSVFLFLVFTPRLSLFITLSRPFFSSLPFPFSVIA